MKWGCWASVSLVLAVCGGCTCEEEKEAGRSLGVAVKDCWRAVKDCWRKAAAAPVSDEPRPPALLGCLHRRVRAALRRALSSDVIPLADGVQLVRYTNNSFSRMENDLVGWGPFLLDALTDVFDTHAIRITMTDSNEEARRRRKNHMFPLMMFGVFGLGMILIPMGFKFLAVLGGKALLLAKMALLLSSIQGLKKVATSGIGYGLYHAPAANPWYDRKAEDIESSYRLEEGYLNQYPEQVIEYKRYPHV